MKLLEFMVLYSLNPNILVSKDMKIINFIMILLAHPLYVRNYENKEGGTDMEQNLREIIEHSFRHIRYEGFDYYCLNVERNDNGDALLGIELNKRIVKLKLNIEKCGSFKKLEEIGGKATLKYIAKTRNMLRFYLFLVQAEYLLTSIEDLNEAIHNVNTSNEIQYLVEKASWKQIEEYAQSLRNSLVTNWRTRREEENKQKQNINVA